MDAQKILLEDGIKHGMCEKFQKILSGGTLLTDEILMLYHKGLDFCIEHNWPSVELIRKLFTTEELSRNGIYYSSSGKIKANQCTVICEQSDLTVVVPKWSVCSIYIRHNSNVNLIVEEHSNCYVTLYDNAKVSVIAKSPTSRLNSSLFSGDIVSPEYFDNINYKNIK